MEEKVVKVARLRNIPYTVNYISGGLRKPYEWAGSKGLKMDVKPLPEEVVNYLLMNSSCFRDGELKIIEDETLAKELVENIDEKEEYENNTHTREELIKILEGNFNKMKSELNKITNIQEKRFVCDVAIEMDLDSASKREFIAEWMGTPVDILFAKEEK